LTATPPDLSRGCEDRSEAPLDDVNLRYFVHYASQSTSPGARILDFGCGAGSLVAMLRSAGFDAYGVDIRWPGWDYGDLESTDLGRKRVLRYYEEDGGLPFPDATFDLVVSNQVLEHVVPIDAAVRELARVVKPAGTMYHHYPTRIAVREPHIGIPMAHRLPKGRARLYYAAALRRLGLGIHKDDRPALEWAAASLDHIDHWTIYRRPPEIEQLLSAVGEVRHREIDYCRFRAGDRAWLRRLLDVDVTSRLASEVFRRLGFDAVEVKVFEDAGRVASRAQSLDRRR
jgi:SAM-dependent methyltransferase